MSYLGIDTARARELTATLREIERRVEPILQLVTEAERLADLATNSCLALDEVGADAGRSADHIDRALNIVEGFQLRLSVLVAPLAGTQDLSAREWAAQPLWDATPEQPWNLVHQVASHNSYVVPGGIPELYGDGVRTFELDIHRGAPTNFTTQPFPWGVPSSVAIVSDHFDHEGGRDDDWRVYHTSVSPDSEYLYLSDGLAAVASLDTVDPLTVFVDNKDAFAGTHTSAAFDQLLEETLGDRLYGPEELLARVPGASSVHEAVVMAGWPTVAELEGRILVVLTDEVGAYDPIRARSFIAPPPQFVRDDLAVVHIADDDVVFYNADARSLDSDERVALQNTASVVRTYFGPQCLAASDGAVIEPNYRAVDHPGTVPHCVVADGSSVGE